MEDAARDLFRRAAEAIEGLAQVLLRVRGVDPLRRLGRGVAQDVLDLGELGAVVQHHPRLQVAQVVVLQEVLITTKLINLLLMQVLIQVVVQVAHTLLITIQQVMVVKV